MTKSQRHHEMLIRFAQSLHDREWEIAIELAHALGDARVTKAIPILLGALKGKYPVGVKNAAAIGLRELRANEAVPVLFRLIRHPAYRGNRGTFVYALEALDWSPHTEGMIRLIFDKNAEVREEAVAAFKRAVEGADKRRAARLLRAVLEFCFQSCSSTKFKARATTAVDAFAHGTLAASA